MAKDDLEPYFLRGMSYLKQKSFKDAEEDFLKALGLPGAEEKPEINDGLGCCYMGV